MHAWLLAVGFKTPRTRLFANQDMSVIPVVAVKLSSGGDAKTVGVTATGSLTQGRRCDH